MDLNLLDEVKTALAVDAIYGPITTGAVREFQAAHPPLKATGVADAGTQAAIEEAKAEEQDQTDIARKLFALGGKAYEKGKYGHAYAFFTRAHELAPRPQLTFSRAQALRRLGGRREEAIALYEEYLATDNPARKADAESALAELRSLADGRRDRRHRDRQGRTSTRAPGCTSRATSRTPTTSSRWPASSPRGRRCCSHAPRRCVASAAAARRRSRSTSSTSRATSPRARATPRRRSPSSAPRRRATRPPTPTTGKAHFNKGAGQYEQGNFAQAYDQFTMAGELAPRSSLLFSRAQALRRLGGREAEAMELYAAYIEAGGERAEEAEQMLELLRTHGAAP